MTSDRDKLIELLRNCIEENIGVDDPNARFEVDYENIVDYLLANGVIVPPCKVGDMAYKIDYCRCGNPECFEMKHCYKKDTKRTPKVIDSIMLSQKGKRLVAPYKFEWQPIGTICYKIIQKPFKLEWLTEIGKTVFLTKEEAEEKLKELGK